MKTKALLSILAAALLLAACSASAQPPKTAVEYKHIDFVSDLPQENCFLCGDGSNPTTALHWGEDNIGIINLNTFELLRIEINRYDNYGQLIEDVAGYTQSSGLHGDKTYITSITNSDKGYSHVQITGVQYSIDRESIQRNLCQACLDSINNMWFSRYPPAEYAILSFTERTIRPLSKIYPWFSAGNFGIDCEFEDNGVIDLLIHYCPSRYE